MSNKQYRDVGVPRQCDSNFFLFYRIHCMGICSAGARVGTMVGVTLNDMGHFNSSFGPAFAGGLSIVAAILSRLLPDSTCHKMLSTQQQIERLQFPSLTRPAATTSLPNDHAQPSAPEGVSGAAETMTISVKNETLVENTAMESPRGSRIIWTKG